MDNNLNLEKMKFEDIDKVSTYTGNNHTNKSMKATERPKVLTALLQLFENTNNVFRQLNAYDSSSIIIAESNWIKRNHFSKYMPSKGATAKVQFGQVCTIDYGKTYSGEIGYVHPGLCIGKKNSKYLFVPMTTGGSWRSGCYHPIYNPDSSKDNRQSYISEGFSKDGVLLVHDTKFVSGGRILELHETIVSDALYEIQNQVLSVMFPIQYKEITALKKDKLKYENQIQNLQGQVKNLKLANEKLSSKLNKLETLTQTDNNEADNPNKDKNSNQIGE